MKDEEALNIKQYENNVYLLKDEIKDTKYPLKKGTKVKLYIKTGDDYIKVYCYPQDIDFLKSDRTLVLYLFEDDFEKSTYAQESFEQKLYEKVEISGK